jgi:antitoxin CptB
MEDVRIIELAAKEKIRWQCRRGMLELDLLLGHFFEKQFENLSEAHQLLFVELLQEADQTLYRWLIKHNDVVEGEDKMQEKFTLLLHQIRQVNNPDFEF